MHDSLPCMLWQHSVMLCSPHSSLAYAQTLDARTILQVQHWGYKAIAVSVASGQGMGQLAEALDGRISAVAGPSGVGKSSIINALRLRAQHAQQPQHKQHAQQAERNQQHGQPDKAQQDVHVSMGHSNSSSNSNSGATASPRDVQSAEPAEESNQNYSEASQPPATEQASSNIAPDASDLTASSQDTLTQTADVAPSSSLHPSQEDGEQQQPGNGVSIPAQQQHSNKPNAGLDNSSASSSHTLQNDEASSSSSFAFGMPSHTAGQHLEEEEEQVGMGAQSGVAEGVRLQSVGEMSNIGRGMHTTRHVALLEVHRSSSSDRCSSSPHCCSAFSGLCPFWLYLSHLP